MNDDVVNLGSKRFIRDHEQYLERHRALIDDLDDLVTKHMEKGCSEEMLISALAEFMVRIGVDVKTNGLSLLKFLAAEIDMNVPWGETAEEARYELWFSEGVPPEWKKDENGLTIYKAKTD
jgi:hypothetical protein